MSEKKQEVAVKSESTAVAAGGDLRQTLKAMTPHFKTALEAFPDMDAERFCQVAVTALNKNPDLTRADRGSLVTCFMQAAHDGLNPDGREGAVVLYGNKAAWMPMYQGLLKRLAKKEKDGTGGILITTRVVHEKDEFDYVLGEDERIEHKPYTGMDDPGPLRCVYLIAKKDGEVIHREVMLATDVQKARATSKSSDGPAWKNWPDEMARKCVVHRAAKWMPIPPTVKDFVQRIVVDPETSEATTDITPAVPQITVASKPTSKLDSFEAQPVPVEDDERI